MTTTILLANSQPIVRAGLTGTIDVAPDLEIVGLADNGESALELIRSGAVRPDVLLLAGETCDEHALETVRAVVALDRPPAILLIFGNLDDATAVQALIAGASSCLSTSADPNTIIQNIRTIATDSVILPAQVGQGLLRRLRPHFDGRRSSLLRQLPARERAVLELLASGHSNNEIAQSLMLSEATVKKHLSHVLRKLGLNTRLEAGLFAYQSGLGPTGPVPYGEPASY